MKTAVFASLLAGAAAFAPVSQKSVVSSSALKAYDNELGVIAPTGFFGKSALHVVVIAIDSMAVKGGTHNQPHGRAMTQTIS